ncbi:MAG: winged helix-turn-helix domain-containing protein, partial [Candidatus Microthrix parvicella]
MPVGEPSLPKWNETFWPTISALKELGGSGTIQEIDDEVVRQQDYSDAQLAVLHGDGEKSEIAYRLAWARTNLNLDPPVFDNSPGLCRLTDAHSWFGVVSVVRGAPKPGSWRGG